MDAAVLPYLTAADLTEMGIVDQHESISILKAVHQLQYDDIYMTTVLAAQRGLQPDHEQPESGSGRSCEPHDMRTGGGDGNPASQCLPATVPVQQTAPTGLRPMFTGKLKPAPACITQFFAKPNCPAPATSRDAQQQHRHAAAQLPAAAQLDNRHAPLPTAAARGPWAPTPGATTSAASTSGAMAPRQNPGHRSDWLPGWFPLWSTIPGTK